MRELKENRDLFIKVPVSDYETGIFSADALLELLYISLKKSLWICRSRLFIEYMQKSLHNYTYLVIIMQNYSKKYSRPLSAPHTFKRMEANLGSRRIYEREENNYEAKGIY